MEWLHLLTYKLMPNSYLQQTSTLSPLLPGVIPSDIQQQNQFSSIISDIKNLIYAVNGLKGSTGVGSSWFQNQNVVTTQRTLGAIYQNITGKTILVTITANISSTSSITIFTDSTLSPTIEVAANNAAATKSPVTFMVLNNNYYTTTTTGTVVLVCWAEWS